jgi:hypothetical protein
MKRKLPNLKIEYGGEKFIIDLTGKETSEADSELYSLGEKCAELVISDLNGKMFFDKDEQEEIVRHAVQNTVYCMIKFRLMRPLNQHLLNYQRGSEM